MKLHHVAGNTYYINYPSVVGVYKFDDDSCLLIDSGASPSFGTKTLKILDQMDLSVHGIINTHFHSDHSGGNAVIQEQTNCPIYASPVDKMFIENPLLSPFSVYSAYPLEPLKNKFVMNPYSKVTDVVEDGKILIKNKEFKIIELTGHTMGQIGIVTPDDVFFTGDAIISKHSLRKFPFLYMADLDSYLNTIEKLKNTNYPYVVVSHEGLLEDWREALEENERCIETIIQIILQNTGTPKSRETIIQEVINNLDLPINTSQYFLISASVSAYISYLHSKKMLKSVIEDKQVRFYR
ncbi:MAG: MBL fold metallo-hydrolase [Syntrophomonadaceae bacterium]|nr:MBL fold metallo-hydrolase [Syntrophomonadaceae bacterium]